ncbi:unnamed protein product [Mucor circinelloides]
MKDTTSDSQDVNSNTTNGSFTDALSDCFELEGHQHKKMVANLLNSVDLHPVRLQSQTGDTLTAFATRKSLERDIQWYPDIRDWWVGPKVSLILKVSYIGIS